MRFRPTSQADLVAESGLTARIGNNLTALRILLELQAHDRAATPAEQQALARWGSWGAAAAIFDPSRTDLDTPRAQLRQLLTPAQYRAAERTTINAHYTDHAYATAMWAALTRLGFTGGNVLEPGCGAGTFIGTAPAGARMHGVELDPVTAAIAAHLYPEANITAASFADTQFPDGAFDAVIGNVPFADVRLYDPRHNPGRHSIHNHFLIKSLALTRPGGHLLALTSRYTLDGRDPAARTDLYALGDLLGAVRLPTGAHRATAGTDAVTDLLVLRRRPDTAPAPTPDPAWLATTTTTTASGAEYALNGYFTAPPRARPGHPGGRARHVRRHHPDHPARTRPGRHRRPHHGTDHHHRRRHRHHWPPHGR